MDGTKQTVVVQRQVFLYYHLPLFDGKSGVVDGIKQTVVVQRQVCLHHHLSFFDDKGGVVDAWINAGNSVLNTVNTNYPVTGDVSRTVTCKSRYRYCGGELFHL